MSDSRRGSGVGGLFHSIKQSFSKGEKHVDADYEAVYTKFQTLNDTMLKLRANTQNYISAIYSVFLHGNNVSGDYAVLLEEADQPNPYQQLCQELRSAHSRLSQERQQALAGNLTQQVLQPLDETLKSYQPLQARIARRNELHAELEYYLNKVHELSRERDERAAKGKAEKAKDMERYDRNQDKLSKARFDYQNHTSALMADLRTQWNARVELVGPALAAFVQAGKEFVQVYGQELSEVTNSAKLTQAPAEVVQSPVLPSEERLPTVAGDLQTRPTGAATAPADVAAGSNLPAGAALEGEGGMQPPSGAGLTDPLAGAAPVPEPAPMPSPTVRADEPVRVVSAEVGQPAPVVEGAVASIPRDDPNLAARSDSTYQTPATQPAAPPGGQQDAPLDSRTAALGGGEGGGQFVQASTAAVQRDIVVDPSSVLREQSGYTHEAALPGMAQTRVYNVADPDASQGATLKSQGEEESKKQKYEQEHKSMGEVV